MAEKPVLEEMPHDRGFDSIIGGAHALGTLLGVLDEPGININALATRLKAPYRTVKSRVNEWAEAGLMVVRPGPPGKGGVEPNTAYLTAKGEEVARHLRISRDLATDSAPPTAHVGADVAGAEHLNWERAREAAASRILLAAHEAGGEIGWAAFVVASGFPTTGERRLLVREMEEAGLLVADAPGPGAADASLALTKKGHAAAEDLLAMKRLEDEKEARRSRIAAIFPGPRKDGPRENRR